MDNQNGVTWKTRSGELVDSRTVTNEHLVNAFKLFCKTTGYVTQKSYDLLKGIREELRTRQLYTFEMDLELWRDIESRYQDWLIESVETDWDEIRDSEWMWGND